MVLFDRSSSDGLEHKQIRSIYIGINKGDKILKIQIEIEDDHKRFSFFYHQMWLLKVRNKLKLNRHKKIDNFKGFKMKFGHVSFFQLMMWQTGGES